MRGLLLPLLGSCAAAQACTLLYDKNPSAHDFGDGGPPGGDAGDGPDSSGDGGGCERVAIDETFADGIPGPPWGVEHSVDYDSGRVWVVADSPDNSDFFSILGYASLEVRNVVFEVELEEAYVDETDAELGLILIRPDQTSLHSLYLHNLSRVSQRAYLEGQTNWEPCHPTTGCHSLGGTVTADNPLVLRLETDDTTVRYSFRLGDGPTTRLGNFSILTPDAPVELWAFSRSQAAGSVASMAIRRFSLSGCPAE